MSFESSEIEGIARILAAPKATPSLLSTTLNMILDVSAHSATSAELLSAENYAIFDKLIQRLVGNNTNDSHRETILSILINSSAGNETLSTRIIELESPVVECAKIGKTIMGRTKPLSDAIRLRYAQLFANISRHHPKSVHSAFKKHWSLYVTDILEMLSTNISVDEFDYFGYVLMNLSTIPTVREEIARRNLTRLLPLLAPNVFVKRKFCAANIVYNISFDDHLHVWLLKEVSESLVEEDAFIAAIVTPLADASDELSEAEIDKLPLQLQYYDGRRETDLTIVCKLIETLYQLCSTKIGRETLRSKGIYAIIRELDKTSTNSPALSTNSMIVNGEVKRGAPLKLNNLNSETNQTEANNNSPERFEATLHALIGVLIRYESEMCVSDETFSLRKLGDEQVEANC